MSKGDEVRKQALKIATRIIDPERYYGGYPIIAGSLVDEILRVVLKEIAEYLIAHKVSWWVDATNKVVKISRIDISSLDLEALQRGEMPKLMKGVEDGM